jgi:signal transduction histidine kinase
MGYFQALRLGLSPGRRVAIAVASLGVLVATASAVAYHSYGKARDLRAVAEHDRRDALIAERSISAFWRERESIGEYLMIPSPSLAAEAERRRTAFEALAGQSVAASETPESVREAAFFRRALTANAALDDVLTEPSLLSNDRRAIAEILKRLHEAESSVLLPLRAVYQLNESQYAQREARARSATRDALHVELASALLVLAGIGWFAVFATGLVKRVDRSNAALRDADQLKDEFINTVSHELRTPITSIQGYLELLLDTEAAGADPLTDEQRRFLETVTRSSVRLLHLVNDLLLVAQARAGQLEMNKAPCDLVQVARHAVESAFAAAAKSGVALTLRPMVKEARVNADAPRLGQAIDNLISNAIKFTPAGGTIDVEVSQAERASRITITDTGAGMTASELGQLFERFFRTQSAKEGNIKGTGLGLTITKSIIEAHGGTIEVTSEPGTGTAFTITLADGSASAEPQAPRRLRPARADASL